MKCDEFRYWFERALHEDVSDECPEEAYRRHLADCERCAVFFSEAGFGEAVADLAEGAAESVNPEIVDEALRGVRRRVVRRRAAKTVTAVLVLLAAGTGALLAPWKAGESPGPPESASKPTDFSSEEWDERVDEFAGPLAAPDFLYSGCIVVNTNGKVALGYRQVRSNGDVYRFARKLVLSGLEKELSFAPEFRISISRPAQREGDIERLLSFSLFPDEIEGLRRIEGTTTAPEFLGHLRDLDTDLLGKATEHRDRLRAGEGD